jgi:FeS assembly SUF system protein
MGKVAWVPAFAGMTSKMELTMDTKQADLAVPTAPEPGRESAPTPAVSGSSIPAEELEQLTADIVAALKTVYDPEIPADIYELGLIYKIDIDDARNVAVEMTLTAPGCPVAGEMPTWVENAVAAVAGVGRVSVTLTFDPPWEQSRMSDEAKLALNMF